MRAAYLSFLIALFISIGSEFAFSAEVTFEELKAIVGGRLQAVQSIEATFRTYASLPPRNGAEYGPDGLTLLTEFQWGFSRAASQQYLNGRWGATSGATFRYYNMVCRFDGKRLMGRTDDSGEISNVGNTFGSWRNPLVLMGEIVGASQFRNISEILAILANPRVDAPSLHTDGCYIIQGDFDDGQPMHLIVWVDPRKGHSITRIDVYDDAYGVLRRRTVADDVKEVVPGIWVPLRGTETPYSTELIVPAGMTEEQLLSQAEKRMPAEFASLSPEERGKLPRHKKDALLKAVGISYEAKPMGVGTVTYIVDPSSVKVNHDIPASSFVIDFPKNFLIWDEFQQKSYRFGTEDRKKLKKLEKYAPIENRSSGWTRGDPWAIQPRELVFRGFPGSTQSMTLKIIRSAKDDFNILAVKSPISDLFINQKVPLKVDSDGVTFTVSATIPPNPDVSPTDVEFISDHSRHQSCRIQVRRIPTLRYRVIPPTPVLTVGSTQAEASQLLTVECDEPFSIQSLKADGNIRASVRSKGQQTKHLVEIVAVNQDKQKGVRKCICQLVITRGVLPEEREDIPVIVIAD